MKVDLKVLDKFSDKKTVDGFNREVEAFLDNKSKTISREAIAYFYLTLHKVENEQEGKRRGLTLEETHRVIRGLQGQILTLMEASLEGERLKAVKAIINNHFSHAQSLAQDYDWGREDETDNFCPKCAARGVNGCSC